MHRWCRVWTLCFGSVWLQATAKTARLHRAKRLLQDTDLQITEIAYRAGFKSLRRFNAAFADLYKRPPSAFRRRGARPSDAEGEPASAHA